MVKNVITRTLTATLALGIGITYGDSSQLTPDQRLQRLENQVGYLSQQTDQVQQLQQEVTQLTANVQQMQQELSKYKENQQALSFLEKRMMQLETTNRLASHVPSQPSALNHNEHVAHAEQSAFESAYNMVMQRKYEEAVSAFKKFIKVYPKSTLVTDAYYWLGELYLTKGQPDLAIQQLRKVVSDEKSDKRPLAMEALGRIFLANGDSAHAKELFDQVIKDYKGSPAAKRAQEGLKSLGSS